MPSNRVESRTSLAAAIGAQALFGATFILRSAFALHGKIYFSLFDDAMISMRYARNLVDGFGLVWNPGEPRVEGYSNLLWTLWMAVLHKLAPEAMVSLLVMLTGLAVLLVNVAVIWAIARELEPHRSIVAAVAAMAVALCYPLGYWTLRGMEVGLAALSVDLAVLAVIAPGRLGRWRTPILIACLTALPLIRDDGLVPAALVGTYQLAAWRARGEMRQAWLIFAVPFVAFGSHEQFRRLYYGDWLPNTYYLKVEGVPLAHRAWRGLSVFGLVVLRNLWSVAWFASLARPLAPKRRLLTAVAAAMCLYSVSVGGDAWEWFEYPNRYLTTALPLAIVLAACGIDAFARHLSERRQSSLVWLGAAGAALFVRAIAGLAWNLGTEPDRALQRGAFYVVFGTCCTTLLLIAVRRRSQGGGASHSTFYMATMLMSALLMGTVSGPGALEWIRHNGQHVDDDAEMAALGVALRDKADPRTTIAISWAGAVPYFSHLTTVDLLGKNDRYVAHLPSREPFIPGHSKWDYTYSIGVRRPDIVLPPLWQPTAADRDYLLAQGYVEAAGGAWVRGDSGLVSRDEVVRIMTGLR